MRCLPWSNKELLLFPQFSHSLLPTTLLAFDSLQFVLDSFPLVTVQLLHGTTSFMSPSRLSHPLQSFSPPTSVVHFLSYHCHGHLQDPHPRGSYLLEPHTITQPPALSPPCMCGLQPWLGARHCCIPYQCAWSAHSAVHEVSDPVCRTLSPLPAGFLSANSLAFPGEKFSDHRKGTLHPAPTGKLTSSLNPFSQPQRGPSFCVLWNPSH